MGIWDVFCPLCGLSMNSVNEDIKLKKWLKRCTLLLNTNEIIHDTEEIAGNIIFRDKSNKEIEIYKDNGIALHSDCWKLIKQKYNIELKYSDFPIIKYKKYDYYQFTIFNYGKVSKYWSQEFEFYELLNDKNEFMIESPLENIQNQKRVLSIFNLFKIRKDRKSPLISASFFKNNDTLIGNDGNLWQIKNKKWNKLETFHDTLKFKISENKETIDIIDKYLNNKPLKKTNNNILNKLLSLPRLGQVGNGITIEKLNYNKINNKWIIDISVLYIQDKYESWNKIKYAFENV